MWCAALPTLDIGEGALDKMFAIYKALLPSLSWLDQVELADYKVRILTDQPGTDAVTRVLVESTDGKSEWTTVGVHGNIVEASWLALCDALVHKALRADQPV